MTRVVAVTACSFALAACSMSMPSMDLFKSTPPTEVLRVESEPPGADARTSQGQSCRTPCELTVQAGSEMTVSFSLTGYQPQTLQVRADAAPTSYSDGGGSGVKLQPNPVYAELQSLKPPAKKKSAPRKQTAQKPAPATATTTTAPATTGSIQTSYPWPEPR